MRERGTLGLLWNKWKPSQVEDCFAVTEASGIEFQSLKSVFAVSIVLASLALMLECCCGCCCLKKRILRQDQLTNQLIDNVFERNECIIVVGPDKKMVFINPRDCSSINLD